MKLFLLIFTLALSGCYSTAGLVTGAGKDLQAVGSWITPSESIRLNR